MAFTRALFAQDSSLYDLNFEDLLSLTVTTASKEEEEVFNSPLSTSVLTRDQIQQSGVNSIPEALRLIPGLIVREKTHGNYDIHIRGFDYIPPGGRLHRQSNTSTLVMIDNMVVYSYFQGGTFWETLPIDIVDIERIEVIRGPVTALYGPNAVTGLIHFITNKNQTDEIQVSTRYDNYSNPHIQVSSSKRINEKSTLGFSSNYNQIKRFDDSYFAGIYGRYVTIDEAKELTDVFRNTPLITDERLFYTDPTVSLQKSGLNLYYKYNNKDLSVNLSAGRQNSLSQSNFIEFLLYQSERNSRSNYINGQADYKNFQLFSSYNYGNQDLLKGELGYQYDFSQFNTTLRHNYSKGLFNFKTELSFSEANYNTDRFIEEDELQGLFQGNKNIGNTALLTQINYLSSNEKLRLILAGRVDKYNIRQDFCTSYQAIASYKFNDIVNIRALSSKAFRGPFMLDTYYNNETIFNDSISFLLEGNSNLELPEKTLHELGIRARINHRISLDVELYHSIMNNFYHSTVDSVALLPTPPYALPVHGSFENLSTKAEQFGASFVLNIRFDRVNIQAYANLQKTTLYEHHPLLDRDFDSTVSVFQHRWTPSVYGGILSQFKIYPKLNVSSNVYFTSQQKTPTQKGDQTIAATPIVFGKIEYQVIEECKLFIGYRNLFLNNRQFIFGERINTVISFGADFKL